MGINRSGVIPVVAVVGAVTHGYSLRLVSLVFAEMYIRHVYSDSIANSVLVCVCVCACARAHSCVRESVRACV